MKVLVATEETQGQRKNDFCRVPEGELVFTGPRHTKGAVDDECGCSRSLTGIDCRKGTTTACVVEREITEADLADAIRESVKLGGWPVEDAIIVKMAHRMRHLTEQFRVGAVLEYRGGTLKERLRG